MHRSDLVIVGGAELPARIEIMKAFVNLAGGADKRYAILPSATVDPMGGFRKMCSWLGEAGVEASHIVLLEVSKELPGGGRGAWDTAVISMAAAADAIWILGGNQNAITELLLEPDGGDSPLLALLRGKVIGGTSAGAAVMGELMIGGGTSFGALACPRVTHPAGGEMDPGLFVTRGLGFFPEGLVDQHFDTRARLGRLLEASLVEDGARRLAFGVAEATGLVYHAERRRIEVVGRGAVYVLDPRQARRSLELGPLGPRVRIEGAILSLLTEGDSLELATGTYSFGSKVAIMPGSQVFNTPCPVASGVLSAYGDLASFVARLLLDNSPDGLFFDSKTGLRYARSFVIDEAGGQMLAWEIRLMRLEGESSLWHGPGYSFQSVRIDILPLDIKISHPQ